MTSKRRKWLLLLAGAPALTTLIFFLAREHEPSYEGTSLSEWLEINAGEGFYDPRNRTGDKAIRHIGTNALPYLLKWVSYESPKSGIKKTATDLLDKLPDDIKPGFFDDWMGNDFKENRARNAAHALSLFRDEFQLCIPPLVKIMNDTNSPDAAENAVYALLWIGPDALPVFSAQLADTNVPVNTRRSIAFLLGLFPDLATNSPSSVPVLLQCLQDADSRVRDNAVRSLGEIGRETRANASVVVPALTNCLRADAPLPIRYSAVRSLGAYSNEARVAVPLLLDLIDSPYVSLRIRVTNALMDISPEVLTNAPAK